VNDGREELNFSDWQGTRKAEKADKLREEVTEGEMPPLQYRLAHPEARLSAAEKDLLAKGLAATANRR
jgi:hypothetical protein